MRPLLRRHCREEDLVALLDGELLLPERDALERHVAACERCHDLLGQLEQALAALAADLAAGTSGEVVTEPEWRLRPSIRVAGAGVLAGSLGALLVAGLVLRRQQHREGARVAGAA